MQSASVLNMRIMQYVDTDLYSDDSFCALKSLKWPTHLFSPSHSQSLRLSELLMCPYHISVDKYVRLKG